ncbi:MAG: tetratricopeptide repeat protein [Elusimicrobiaceae bacterium]
MRTTFNTTFILAVFFAAFSISGFCGGDDCFANLPAPKKLAACTAAISEWKGKGGDSEVALYYAARANAQYLSGSPEHAREDADSAVNLDPKNPDLYVNRGRLLMRIDEIDSAVSDFNSAVKLGAGSKTSAWAYYNLAVAYTLMGRRDVSDPQLQAGRTLAPEMYQNYVADINYFLKRKNQRLQQARDNFTAGKDAVSAGDFVKAAELFSASYNMEPDVQEYKSWLGSIYFDMGKYAKAYAALTDVSQDQRWNYYIAMTLFKEGKFEESLAAFKTALGDGPAKNRGVDRGAEIAEKIAAIEGYLSAMAEAKSAAKTGDLEKAVATLEKSLGFLDLDSTKALLKVYEKEIADKKSASKKTLIGIGLFVLVLAGMGAFFFTTYKMYKRSTARKGETWEDFIRKIISLRPREAFTSYHEYKVDHEKEAPIVAERMMPLITHSCDFELMLAFSREFSGPKKRDFLVVAAELLNQSGKYQDSFDALQLLNNIPFSEWGDREAAVFSAAHIQCDGVLLDESKKADQSVWSHDINPQAYFSLADIYARKGDPANALKALSKLPQYSWVENHWLLYINCMAQAGRLTEVDLSVMSAQFRSPVIEELFRREQFGKLMDYFTNSPRQKWEAEYYFYAFCITLTERFDNAWEFYKQLADHYPLTAKAHPHYAIGLMCEKAGRYDKAAFVYEAFVNKEIYYQDCNRRRKNIEAGKYDQLVPFPNEILAAILPPVLLKFSAKPK